MYGDRYMREVFFALCVGVDTPRSLGIWLRVKYNVPDALKVKWHPSDYLQHDADLFARDYLVMSYCKKYDFKKSPYDKESAATSVFRNSEDRCHETNDIIKAVCAGRAQWAPPFDRLFDRVKLKIARILGDIAKLDISAGTWGPGATTDIKRVEAHLDYKSTKLPIFVTSRALPHLARAILSNTGWMAAIIAANPGYTGKWYEIVDETELQFAAKTMFTYRTILPQPTGNGYLQRAVGLHIAKRLRKVGIDLTDQGNNQTLASLSMALGLATLDLEAASDSISRELIHFLLPVDWATLLEDLRVSKVRVDGKTADLYHFSAMGNGFTFELESLIFISIVRCVEEDFGYSPHLSSVYGDDIICHQESVPTIVEALRLLGFRINSEKSFTQGVFFESCGQHYFNGTNVTPIYQKERFSTVGSYIRASNRLLKMACRLSCGVMFDNRLRNTWLAIGRLGKLHEVRVGPYLETRNDYFMVGYAELMQRARFRSGPQGYSIIVQSLEHKADLLPAFDDAFYADTLKRVSKRRQRWGLDIEVVSDEPFTGFVESRVHSREKLRHRPLTGFAPAPLDW